MRVLLTSLKPGLSSNPMRATPVNGVHKRLAFGLMLPSLVLAVPFEAFADPEAACVSVGQSGDFVASLCRFDAQHSTEPGGRTLEVSLLSSGLPVFAMPFDPVQPSGDFCSFEDGPSCSPGHGPADAYSVGSRHRSCALRTSLESWVLYQTRSGAEFPPIVSGDVTSVEGVGLERPPRSR